MFAIPAVPVKRHWLEGAPVDLLISGCDKSWNAYTGAESGPGVKLAEIDVRCGGGHMHISADRPILWFDNPTDVFLCVKLFDRIVGLTETYILGSEEAGIRRQWYGKAGEFRYQPHGPYGALEYRTPGPEIYSHPVLISLHFGLLRWIFTNFSQFKKVYRPRYEEQVRDAINRGVSDPSLLDLLPELPAYYTKNLLRLARARFNPVPRKPVDLNLWPRSSYGWDSWSYDVEGVRLWQVPEREFMTGIPYGAGY